MPLALGFELRQRFVGVGGLEHDVSVQFKQLRQALTDVVPIFDDQNGAPARTDLRGETFDSRVRRRDRGSLGHGFIRDGGCL